MGDTSKIWDEYLGMEERYLGDTDIEDILAAKQVFATFLHTLRMARERDSGPWTSLEELQQETGHDFSRFLNGFLELLLHARLYRSLSDACDSLVAAFPASCSPLKIAPFKIEALIHTGEADQAMKWCDDRILSIKDETTPYVEVQDILYALLAAGRRDMALQLCDEQVHLVERCRMTDRIHALIAAMRTIYDAVGDRRKAARLSWLLSENERQERAGKSEDPNETLFRGRIRESRAYFEAMMQDEDTALFREGSSGQNPHTNASIVLFPGHNPKDGGKPNSNPDGTS